MARLKVEFEGFDSLIDKIRRLEGNTEVIAEKALTEVHGKITPKVKEDIRKHYMTGETEGSITEEAEIEWTAQTASVKVGFDIRHGGLASIFLMYGTPRMEPDKKLYNEFYGSTVKKKIRQIEEDVLYEEIRRLEL